MADLLVAIAGVSGVGKSAAIQYMRENFNGRYEYVKPFITRPLREGETDKVHLSSQEFDRRVRTDLILPNEFYGSRYAPSLEDIKRVLTEGRVALLDWPVSVLMRLKQTLDPITVIGVYLLPPDTNVLRQRLANNGRNNMLMRLDEAHTELYNFHSGCYKGIDAVLTNDGEISDLAAKIDGFVMEAGK